MSIDFRCPSGHKLSVDDALAGRKARCPLCRQKMWVPLDNSQPNQLAAPVEEENDPNVATAMADHAVEPRPEPFRYEIYRPDAGKVQTVQLLAIGLALAASFQAAPAMVHWRLGAAPGWAQLVLLLAVMQLAYVAWMLTIPDWSSVWVVMLLSAVIAALYGAAMAIFMYTPADAPLVLGLSEGVRHSAAWWCAAVVLLSGMMTYAAGRVSGSWRRSYEIARRRARRT